MCISAGLVLQLQEIGLRYRQTIGVASSNQKKKGRLRLPFFSVLTSCPTLCIFIQINGDTYGLTTRIPYAKVLC